MRDNEKPISFTSNKIQLTMHPFYTDGKHINYPTYNLTLNLNWKEMHELRDALMGIKPCNTIRALLDAALIDVGAPVSV